MSPRKIAEMWLDPEGYDKQLFSNYMDYGPKDRHKRFTAPTLWLYARPTRGGTSAVPAIEKVPSGNPFLYQFSRYFPDLRARPINAEHFFIEEAAGPTNRLLLEFLKGQI